MRKTREREGRPEDLTSGNCRCLPRQRRKRQERFGEEGQVCTEHAQQCCLCKSCTHWNLKRGTGRSLYKEDISRRGTRQEDQQRRGPGLSSRPNTTWYCPSQAFYWPLNLNFLNKETHKNSASDSSSTTDEWCAASASISLPTSLGSVYCPLVSREFSKEAKPTERTMKEPKIYLSQTRGCQGYRELG